MNKTFKDLYTESSEDIKKIIKEADGEDHLAAVAEFKKIVKKIGGKSIALKILSNWKTEDYIKDTDITESTDIKEILTHLKDSGFKLKSNVKTKRGIELEFHKVTHAKEAFEDLKSVGIEGISLENDIILVMSK